MAVAKKAKKPRMTQREKKWRAEWREDMRAKGVLPPKKKPLNRKKFVKEAREEFNAAKLGLMGEYYMIKAIGWVISEIRPSPEAIGVAKMLKVTCAIARFETELKEKGLKEYDLDNLYEYLKPILDA